MRKIILKSTYIVLILSIIITSIVLHTPAENLEKRYCSATLDDNFTDNEILIVIMPFANFHSYSISSFSDIGCTQIEELSYNIIENQLSRIIKLTLAENSKQNVLNSIRWLEEKSDIYSAEPNYIGSFEVIAQDPYYVNNEQWAISQISLPSAWEVVSVFSTVRVGVIDSGIDASHPDLASKVNTTLSKCFTSAYSTGIGDAVGHGTHVAGIIGAGINNRDSNNQYIGIAGTSPNVELISLRVDDGNGNPDSAAVISAISYASLHNIPILNCSIGMKLNYEEIASLKLSIELFDGLMICAAGNNGTNNNIYRNYPSDVNSLTNIISVGASNKDDAMCDFSNYGSTSVDIFAPGEDILSTVSSSICSSSCNTGGHYASGYHHWSGTSMAAPYVTGVAALMLSVNPNLQSHQIKDIILRSVDVIDGFEDLCMSGGRLNAYKAVNTARMQYLNCDTTYSTLPSTNSLSSSSHMVYYDICSECSCDIYNGTCNNCGICDPCENCHVSYTELHNYRVIDYSSTQHILYCDDCDTTNTGAHELYVLYEEESQIVIKCKWCSYIKYCESYIYTMKDNTHHTVSCTACNYVIQEEHQFQAEYIENNAVNHNVICLDCGYSYYEAHSWLLVTGNIVICRSCGITGYLQ